MYSLYPSFMACLCLLAFTSLPVGMVCIRQLGISVVAFWLLLILNALGLLLHFSRPAWNMYWMPAVLFVLYHLLTQTRLRLPGLVQVLLIAVGAQSLVEYVVGWYPYPDWKGVPLYLFFTAAWCLLSCIFHAQFKTALTQVVAICAVGLVRECIHERAWHATSLVNIYNFRDAALLCNIFWMSICVLVLLTLLKRLWENSKLRNFRVI